MLPYPFMFQKKYTFINPFAVYTVFSSEFSHKGIIETKVQKRLVA